MLFKITQATLSVHSKGPFTLDKVIEEFSLILGTSRDKTSDILEFGKV